MTKTEILEELRHIVEYYDNFRYWFSEEEFTEGDAKAPLQQLISQIEMSVWQDEMEKQSQNATTPPLKTSDKERFLELVSKEETPTIERNQERINNRSVIQGYQERILRILNKLEELGVSSEEMDSIINPAESNSESDTR